MSAYRVTSWLLLLPVLFALPTTAYAGDDSADKKTIERILQDIDLVPLMYAKGEKPMRAESLPKFSAIKLAEYRVGKELAVAEERKRYQANREKYAQDFPLRAAIFDAADAIDKIAAQEVRRNLPRTLTPKDKIAVKRDQDILGLATFQLEQALVQMSEAGEQRDKEKSKRWQANFDFARARLAGNFVFLVEYNFLLGQIRADNLPALAPGDDGWTPSRLPKIVVPEAKAKNFAKGYGKLLQTIQKNYADTPWAYFAERDSQRALGMQWMPKKK